mgnify:CR=1 FL=1
MRLLQDGVVVKIKQFWMVIYLLGEKLTLPQGVDCTIVVIVVEVYTI